MPADQIPTSGVLPDFTLRAHPAPVTAAAFASGVTPPVLASADESGGVFVWDVVARRPVSMFRAHSAAIVKVEFVTIASKNEHPQTYLLTHGRDHCVHVYNAGPALARIVMARRIGARSLGANGPPSAVTLDREIAELDPLEKVYTVPVNALNYCGFSVAIIQQDSESETTATVVLAVPGTTASENVDVYTLRVPGFELARPAAAIPGPEVVSKIPKFEQDENPITEGPRQNGAGIVMSLCLVDKPSQIYLVAGYESGHTATFIINNVGGSSPDSQQQLPWKLLECKQLHTQPVLALALRPQSLDQKHLPAQVYSTAADARIALTLVPPSQNLFPFNVVRLSAPGTASAVIRSDGKLLATAGWDGLVRVFELLLRQDDKEELLVLQNNTTKQKLLKPLASFPGGRQNGGITAVAFGPIETTMEPQSSLSLVQRLSKSNSHYLAVAGKDGRIGIYSLY
ncbi:uncharacterized protein SAPINGB_P001918 [Magnusiomyces paraingens]|uniref:ASTRA-associated protein 1 n=1 Tax=Magnusiomyces paraingens TaxID=2606893 RepID=A0A5E8BCB9_9ASCO|nr:uncharacterized protein SAPINGB_P001918 [Saprochaete ingens]VVT48721.1 unnamed protein product [Saprochaete ingens]